MSGKQNGQEMAFPIYMGTGNWISGLTKRELLAGLAMQGILSNSHPDAPSAPADVSKAATLHADFLLGQLARTE